MLHKPMRCVAVVLRSSVLPSCAAHPVLPLFPNAAACSWWQKQLPLDHAHSPTQQQQCAHAERYTVRLGYCLAWPYLHTCLPPACPLATHLPSFPRRLCSHVGTYFHPPSKAGLQQVLSEPLPFEAKVDGIAFVSSRCEVPSGRSALVQAMADTKMYRVASYGGCLKSHVKAAVGGGRSRACCVAAWGACAACRRGWHMGACI